MPRINSGSLPAHAARNLSALVCLGLVTGTILSAGCAKSWLGSSDRPGMSAPWRWLDREEAARRAMREKVADDPFPSAEAQGITRGDSTTAKANR
ncbi:MAG: hypothetical protein JSS27_18270 [Planctomycetes bacterium]|nr:hypothetical protein [Planctomycetota bacterium]